MGPRAAAKKGRDFDPLAFLATIGVGRKFVLFPRKHIIFTQGDPSDAVFYIQQGKVRLAVVSDRTPLHSSQPSAWAGNLCFFRGNISSLRKGIPVTQSSTSSKARFDSLSYQIGPPCIPRNHRRGQEICAFSEETYHLYARGSQ